ncbi:glycosyltransferase family 4 protein [Microbacterium kyungheense]|uniref:D-inositol 3-phosphate glycosyltransferase n=1 Tax=Microbacterium kyungheense TaxID=1263636 RepID=A0A543ERU6_9MICO|nr:glycosyltransferase family 4 protein [Microbacterium kyungheense]TQM24308.1 glycogen(starch) synthase [Microbacterium kyungheense]
MRVALVASSYLPRLGGVEEHVFHLARRLRTRGHEVVVWAVDQQDDVPAEDDGHPLRYLPTPLPSRSVGGVLRWARALPGARSKWRSALRRDAPDVIVVQCFGSNGPWATALAKRAGVPLVYANHGETFMDAHDAFASSRLLRRSLSTALRQAQAVTSCSPYAADDLDRFGAHAPVTIVGNGIDPDTDAEQIPDPLPRRYIAGVGRLVENKGFDVLIDAFALAAAELGDTGLVIAGDGPERSRLEARALERGIAPRVTFTGSLRRAQVRTLLDGALAQVVPSRVEAFGIVILEGWRSGIPVLATRHGGPADLMTHGVDGLLFDPRDAAELGALLAKVATDSELRAALGAGGRRTVARYTWDHVTDAYEDVLCSVVAGKPAVDAEPRS